MRWSSAPLALTIVLSAFGLGACGADRSTPHASPAAPAPTSASPTSSPSPSDPRDFDDEFSGSTLDRTKWTRESGTGYGTETFVAGDRYARLDGVGHLVITAERNARGVWDSGELSTRNVFSMRSGVVEIRAKLPRQQGAWPAFWLHNSIHGEAGPPHAEIDLMEVFPGGGSEGDGAYLTLHDWTAGSNADRNMNLKPDRRVLDGKFHTWRLDWKPDRIALSIDGVSQGAFTPSNFTAGRWVFSQVPLYFLMGISVGGDGLLPPSASTTQMTMVVDYVRMTRTS